MQPRNPPWWKTATLDEWQRSHEAVVGLVQAQEPLAEPSAESTERLARAIALQSLLGEATADILVEMVERRIASFTGEHANAALQAWLPRGEQLACGLLRCAVLLGPAQGIRTEELARGLQSRLQSLRLTLIDDAMRRGTTRAIQGLRTVRFRKR